MSKNKSAVAIALLLMLLMASSFAALPFVSAQNLVMNLPGEEGTPYDLEIHESIDIDLNGPSSFLPNVTLWAIYPGRTEWTYINGYPTDAGGDLDVYDFDFNETGDFQLKWMVDTASSNVEIARVWPVGQVPRTVIEYLTHIYIVASPVTGINQEMFIVYWTDRIPPDIGEQSGQVYSPSGRCGWYDVQLEITKPDDTTETIDMPYSDPVGGGYLLYTPVDIGTYSVKAIFPGAWKNDTRTARWYTPHDSAPVNFTVQEELVPGWPEAPLPTDYWMRPISGTSHSWSAVAGNWLGGAANVWPPGAAGGVTDNYGYGSAPESAHILWTHSLFDSGSLVDERFGAEAYTLNHYQDVDFQSFIVNGKIHYPLQLNAHYPGGGRGESGWGILSLYTGEQLKQDHNLRAPDFGQIYIYNSGNQHGAFEYVWRTSDVTLPEIVYLGRSSSPTNTTEDPVITGTLWEMLDGFTGQNVCYVANVSSGGTAVYGKDGSILRYNFANLGSRSNPDYHLQVWNVSAIQDMRAGDTGTNAWMWRPSGGSHGGTPHKPVLHDGSTGFSLDVSIPNLVSTSIRAVREGEYIIVGSTGSNDESGVEQGKMAAYSLEEGEEGTKLWETSFTPPFDPEGNYQGLAFRTVVPEHNVMLFSGETELIWYAYDLQTGQKLWESEPRPQLEYYSMDYNIYDDMVMVSGRAGGVLTAYDLRTGEVRWEYVAEGEGTESPYGNSVIRGTLVAEGKVYLSCSEHSGSTPLWRGPNLRCLNVTTGEEIWKILFWGGGLERVADGILIGWSLYDGQVYGFGKGPSGVTVDASPKTSVLGTSVVVEGTVTDQTPTGRRNINNELQFSLKDTPAISDDDMQAWMEYMFMQQGRPENAKGVEVKLETLDPNGNFYEIGRTTSDASGTYGYAFTPEVPGLYTVIATFEGSKSYYGSYAKTYINVEDAPQATPTAPPPEPSMADLYFMPMSIGIIIAIVAVGLVLVLILRKR